MEEITYKWIISAIDCLPIKDGFENVVDVVHWRYKANCSIGNCYEAYGACSLPEPNPDTFILTEELSFEQITKWLEGTINMTELQERVNEQIMIIKKPEKINISLNWDENNSNEPLTF